jgi:hypothetical protein
LIVMRRLLLRFALIGVLSSQLRLGRNSTRRSSAAVTAL